MINIPEDSNEASSLTATDGVPSNWDSMNDSEKVQWLNKNFDHLNDEDELKENRVVS